MGILKTGMMAQDSIANDDYRREESESDRFSVISLNDITDTIQNQGELSPGLVTKFFHMEVKRGDLRETMRWVHPVLRSYRARC